MGRVVPSFCALVLIGCGLSTGGGSSDANSGRPPNAGLEERPSEYRRWAVLGQSILHFEKLLSPEVTVLGTSPLVGMPSISPDATTLAYAVGSGDASAVELVNTSDFTTPTFEWKLEASSPILSWNGGQSVLVSSQGVLPRDILLDLGNPLPFELGTGSIVASGAKGAVFQSDQGVTYLGTGAPPRFVAAVEPDGVGVAEDGTRIALVSSDDLGLGSDPLPLAADGVGVDLVRWVPLPPPSCPYPDAPSCEVGPGYVSVRRVEYAPDDSELYLEESFPDSVRLSYAAVTSTISIPMGSGERVAYGVGDHAWGFLRDGRAYFAVSSPRSDENDDAHRLVVVGAPDARMPGVAQAVVPSGDQQWIFVSVWRRDEAGAGGEHAVEATFLAGPRDMLPTELFKTSDIDLFVVPSPVGADLVVGSQSYDHAGFYCSDAPRTDCDGISYSLVRDARPGAVPLRGLQGPRWTPDGQGLLGERNGKIVYVPRDAPDQVYELAPGRHTMLRMPSAWQ